MVGDTVQKIRALMVDVDGVLIRGRPEDGLPWPTSLEADLGVSPEALHRAFFAPYWEDIVVGRAALDDRLTAALAGIAPHLESSRLIDYWFSKDARLDEPLLRDLARLRAGGVEIHLATNQEHKRARYLMEAIGLAEKVDGMHYSAALGHRKPNSEFFRAVAAKTGFSPEELLLVDDSSANVGAAINAGWNAIVWTGEAPIADLLRRAET